MILVFERADAFEILIFWIRFIKNMILLVAEVYAPEAVLAAFAVIAEIAVRAVQTVAAEVAVIAFLHVHALVAEL